MLFFTRTAVLGATYLLLGISKASDCLDGPWTNVTSTGALTGTEFCATKYQSGVVITGVEAWGNTNWIKSARSKPWGNGFGLRLGRVYTGTKKGTELEVGKNTDGQNVFETNVQSGIILGAFSRSGDRIDQLGFLFLRSKIDSITIDNVVFKDTPEALNEKKQGLEMVTLDYADHTNDHPDANETFTFGKSETRTTSKEYSQTATHTFGFTEAIEVSGEILGLGAKSTTTLSYEYSYASTEESSKEDSVTLTYMVATTLKPDQRVFCKAVAMRGIYKGEYNARVNIHL
ncbi:uncharacterized protein BDR25DRAFT_319049 [Lindgomyces ingoldianus]|uniref:Uncharacterized protein n=1 Tax=Lindgomyces ingoldianus TaxID=673940 RepID=A0ACB6QCN7_9PLEO|nr:uncharacterized protein BDR25DRAFT_319049 [Lindgomyces ingoldianus]KAF2464789.1 hypothetical protein BDR25DRAFT_319049 [Lindgomyces ingoldianus]